MEVYKGDVVTGTFLSCINNSRAVYRRFKNDRTLFKKLNLKVAPFQFKIITGIMLFGRASVASEV